MKTAHILSLCTALLLVGVGCTGSVSAPTAAPTPEPVTIPQPPQGVTSDSAPADAHAITTYTDPKGFSVSYPAGWEKSFVDASIINGPKYLRLTRPGSVHEGYSQCPKEFAMVEIGGPENYTAKHGTFEKFIVSLPYDHDGRGGLGSLSGGKEILTVNGMQAVKFGEGGAETTCGGPVYFIKLNDREYLAASTYADYSGKQSTQFETIDAIIHSIKATAK